MLNFKIQGGLGLPASPSDGRALDKTCQTHQTNVPGELNSGQFDVKSINHRPKMKSDSMKSLSSTDGKFLISFPDEMSLIGQTKVLTGSSTTRTSHLSEQ